MTNNLIRTKPEPICKCCQSEGTYIYRNLKDRLFGVKGEWHLKKCNNINCGLIWQDPMPIEEDLGIAYQTYYTHQDSHINIKRSHLEAIFSNGFIRIKQGYLATKYQYGLKQIKLVNKLLGLLLYLDPGRRAWVDSEVFYLSEKQNGKLLEVGFGSGEMLRGMQQKGWIVEGIDFDPNAVSNALSKGLNVRLGSLTEQHYADNTFDAIVMSHVIEHVADPTQFFKESYRVLKEGGILVSITPNTQSFGHKIYKENWRGLEPPRHLKLFNNSSIKSILSLVGFNSISVKSTIRGANGIMIASSTLRRQDNYKMGSVVSLRFRFLGIAFQFLEWFLMKFNKNLGEELLVIAVK